MDALQDYGILGGLLLAGLVLALPPLVIPLLVAPRARGEKSLDTYECGMETVGSAWIRFSVSYYLFALVFVAFEVDVLYLFPVAVVYGQFVWRDLIEVSIFLGILLLALLHAWRRGVLGWK